jgi:hypothetical protein
MDERTRPSQLWPTISVLHTRSGSAHRPAMPVSPNLKLPLALLPPSPILSLIKSFPRLVLLRHLLSSWASCLGLARTRSPYRQSTSAPHWEARTRIGTSTLPSFFQRFSLTRVEPSISTRLPFPGHQIVETVCRSGPARARSPCRIWSRPATHASSDPTTSASFRNGGIFTMPYKYNRWWIDGILHKFQRARRVVSASRSLKFRHLDVANRCLIYSFSAQ